MIGFIYLWRDADKSRFYLGSHIGSPDDRYICGSKRMLKVYKERPQSFKRRIVKMVEFQHYLELRALEQKYLDLIKPHEFGRKYYNVSRNAYGADPQLASVWMRGNTNMKGKPCSPEKRAKISAAQKGKIISLQARQNMSAAKKGWRWFTNGIQERFCLVPPAPDWVIGQIKGKRGGSFPGMGPKISASKKLAYDRNRALFGYAVSPETRMKISATKKLRAASALA